MTDACRCQYAFEVEHHGAFQCFARKFQLLTNEKQNCFPLIGWQKKGGGAGGGSGVATELL